jgi:hypothetical protein
MVAQNARKALEDENKLLEEWNKNDVHPMGGQKRWRKNNGLISKAADLI